MNHFNCGGIAIGMIHCHRIADACTLIMFVKAWAAMARCVTHIVAPSFVTSSLFPPRETFSTQMTLESPKHWGDTRRFFFSSSKIASFGVRPSCVELVMTAIWKWAMAQKGPDQRCRCFSVAGHAINIRPMMEPPLSEYVFGNLIREANVSRNGEMDLGKLLSKNREAIGKIDSEYLKELQGKNGYDMVVRECKKMVELSLDREVDYFLFTSWCGFPTHELDFGWGKPVWVSSASPGVQDIIFLMDSVSYISGIKAWITMDEADMMKFEQEACDSSVLSSAL